MKLIDYTEPEHGGLDKYVDESNWVEKVPTTPIRLMKYSRHMKKGSNHYRSRILYGWIIWICL